MNTVSHEVRGFAHRAFVATSHVLIFQYLRHAEKPISVIGVSPAQTKTFAFLLTSHLRFIVAVTYGNKHYFGSMEFLVGMVQR